MADTKTPEEIENDIARERDELRRTVDELQNRFSPDYLVRELGRGLSDHGQDIGEALTKSVKRNPVALALTGVGLAWLISGRSWDETTDAVLPSSARRAVGPRYPDGIPADHDPRVATVDRFGTRRSEPMLDETEDDWLRADDDQYWTALEEDEEHPLSDALSAATDRTRYAAGAARDGVQSAASRAGSGVSEAAARVGDSATGARDAVRERAASAGATVADRAGRLRRRLARGTESLSEEARERVIAARWRAVRARRTAARHARRGGDTAARLFDDNPLVAAGLALAVGAAAAAALPRTRQEDDLVGEHSDRAFDEARRIFEDERRKAAKVADRAAETAKEVLAEERDRIDGQAPTGKTAAEHAVDEVQSGLRRVTEATRDEARKQELGKPVA